MSFNKTASTRHKHADMIIAKANNMDLVVFVKDRDNKFRVYNGIGLPEFNTNFEYFLCQPNHKNSVLNVLNGGQSEFTGEKGWTEGFCKAAWNTDAWYMDALVSSRIKPRKEKRWIIVDVSTNNTSFMYEHKDVALSDLQCESLCHQLIEIEVEV